MEPQPVGVAPTPAVICSDQALGNDYTLTTNGTSVAAASYTINSITNTGGLTASAGAPATGTGFNANVLINDAWTNQTGAQEDIVYNITPVSSAGCEGDPFNVTVSVDPEPATVASFSRPNLCSDVATGYDLSAAGASTYNISINSNGLTASAGSPANGTGLAATVINDDAWTNTTTGFVNVVYTVTPVSAAGCLGDPYTITFPILPEPTGGNDTFVMCSNDGSLNYDLQADNIDVLGNGITSNFSWSAADNANVTGETTTTSTAASITDNLVNTSAVNQTVVYTITPTNSGNTCPGNAFTLTVTVEPQPVGVAPTTAVICSDQAVGNDYTLTTNGTSVAAASYTINSITNTGGLTASAGAPATGTGFNANVLINDAWTNQTGAQEDIVYNITPVSSAGCEGDPFNVTVSVDPEPATVASFSRPNLCSDVATGYTLSAAGASTYNISINSNGLTASAGSPANGTGLAATEINDDAWTNTTTGFVNVVYTVTPVSAAGCLGDPYTITFPILPEPTGGNDTFVMCSNDGSLNYDLQADNIDVLGNGITSNFSWSAADNANVTGETTTTSTAASITDNLVNTSAVNQTVVYTITPTNSGNTCPGNAFTLTVTVEPQPVGVAPTPAVICSDQALGNDYTLTTNGTSVAAASYTINSITNTGGLTASAGAPATGTGFNANVLINDAWTNQTGAQEDIVYNITPVSSAGCEGDPFNVTVSVDPEPATVASFSRPNLCSDVATGYDLSAAGASTYNISINSNGLTASAGSPANGTGLAATVINDDAWTNTTTGFVNVVYTVTPVSAAGCLGDPYTITFPILPEPTGGNDTFVMCSNDGSLNYDLQADNIDVLGNGITSNFSWSAADNANVTGETTTTSTAASITDNLVNTSAVNQTVVYTITPTNSGNTCPGNAFTLTVTVEPQPVGVAPTPAVICSDQALGNDYTLTTNGTSVAAASYTINSITNTGGLTASAGAPATGTGFNANVLINDAWTNQTGAQEDIVYNITPVSSAGCEGDPFNVTVSVDPEPATVASFSRPNLCSDVATGYDLSAAGASTYNISINSNGLTASAGSPANGTGLAATVINDDAWTNTTTGFVNVVYTVTPVSAAGCLGIRIPLPSRFCLNLLEAMILLLCAATMAP